MAQSIRIRRTLTPDLAPTGLALGELAAELNSIPPRLWCGVPTTIDPAGRILLNSLGGPFTPDFYVLPDVTGMLRSSLNLSERLGANAAPSLVFSNNAAPAPVPGNGISFTLIGPDTGVTRINMYGAYPGTPIINFSGYRGTFAASEPLRQGDYMGGFAGYDRGGNPEAFAGFSFYAAEDHTATAGGTAIGFQATPRGATQGTDGMYYHGDGYLGFNPALPLGPPPPTPGHAPGARLTLFPDVGGGYDYSIGLEGGAVWFGVPPGSGFRFYHGAVPTMAIDGTGAVRTPIPPPPDDDSDRVATTAWVRSLAAIRELTSRVEALEAALGITGVGK